MTPIEHNIKDDINILLQTALNILVCIDKGAKNHDYYTEKGGKISLARELTMTAKLLLKLKRTKIDLEGSEGGIVDHSIMALSEGDVVLMERFLSRQRKKMLPSDVPADPTTNQ